MYKLCKTEQSAARQRQLEEGLMEAMKTCHYDEISVSDLCQRMGIPRKSFYRYFSGKDGALQALLDHTMMEYELFLGEKGSRRTLEGELERFFLFWKHNKALLDALERSGLSGILIERAINYAVSDAVFPRRFMNGEGEWMQRQVVTFAVCGLMSLMLGWHLEGYRTSSGEMGKMAARLVTEPLFPLAKKLL